MPWQDILRAVPDDRPIFLAGACGEPTAVIESAKRDPSLFENRTILSGLIPRVNSIDPIAGADGARLRSIFPNSSTKGDRQTRLSWPYSRLYHWLAQPNQVAVAFCQVATTANGDLSLGLAADFMPAMIDAGTPIVGQINPLLSIAPGAPVFPRERFTALFEAETPLPVFDEGRVDDISKSIANSVASLIRPNDTLQLGLGKVQLAILAALIDDPRPLALHGGMVARSAIELLEAGTVSSAMAGVILGDKQVYDRAPMLHGLQLASVGQTHGMATLGRISNLVSINSALSIDLAGQATVESINGRSVSAPGGLPDFHKAALAADNGRAILALRSTTRGDGSAVVSQHPPGTKVSVGALDADIVVTEHGIADLRWRDDNARARAIIKIAAPEHRECLKRAWFEMHQQHV